MADPKATEYIEVESGMLRAGNVEAFRISVADLRALLSAHGLYIVTEADKRVLEAMADVDEETLTNTLESKYTTLENKAVAAAELARRTP